MDLNVGKEVAAMKRMTVNELRAKYADVFGEETKARHKEWLVRRIAWRMQALAEGDISERARQRAAELANDADLRTTVPKAAESGTSPGGMHGDDGIYRHGLRQSPAACRARKSCASTRARRSRSACWRRVSSSKARSTSRSSAVAKAITGTHCNGYLFFRLGGQGGEK